MKVLYLGFVTPEDVFQRLLAQDVRLAVQTQRFGWNFIRALQSGGAEVDVVSVAPVSDFPKNRQILFRRSDFLEGGVRGSVAGFVNVLGVKHFTRHRSMAREVFRRHRQGGGAVPELVIVHGVNSAVLSLGLKVAEELQVPSVVLLTDPPHLATGLDFVPKSLPRRIDFRNVTAHLGEYSASISLTEQLASTFLPARPTLVLEGIAESVRGAGPVASRPEAAVDGPDVLYAGQIKAEYGLPQLLSAVRSSSGSWSLGICGKGSYLTEVLAAAEDEPRICYLGVLGRDELLSAYRGAKILVNPRPPLDFTKFSFPSKLLEYLSYGSMVGSTELPGIPGEYWSVIHKLPADPEGMAAALDELVLDPGRQRESSERAAELREFLRQKGIKAQGERIVEFLTGLLATSSIARGGA